MESINTLEYRIFTTRSEADKAINSLKGILEGINLDGVVNKAEINELNKWALTHQALIKRNPFKEFMYIIQSSLIDVDELNQDTIHETIEDLYWLCQKYEQDSYYYNAVTADLQTLQGLCHGIMADGIINETEIYNLNTWLNRNEHLTSYYPYDELRSLILSIISDKKIEEEEILVLKAFFKHFIRLHDQEISNKITQETTSINIGGLCTSEPEVIFDGKTFCITGVLNRGNRNELKKDIEKLGGITVNSVTKKTDYLIVGDSGNPAWAFACYGRKVEKALNYRKEGHTIMLIHEYDFFDIIDDLK
ncbi:BRCT domain-containing protein [Flavobacterium sp. MK4S-17]|uniref:BRCT domain-containing protein n=1 Tax=Flavobacterium sp. MK4S-17 TaxID=2543737 RepID=UPI0013578F13|nr:BRCT domain-containing protein [Flavobacterium sp. MK4S-17]